MKANTQHKTKNYLILPSKRSSERFSSLIIKSNSPETAVNKYLKISKLEEPYRISLLEEDALEEFYLYQIYLEEFTSPGLRTMIKGIYEFHILSENAPEYQECAAGISS